MSPPNTAVTGGPPPTLTHTRNFWQRLPTLFRRQDVRAPEPSPQPSRTNVGQGPPQVEETQVHETAPRHRRSESTPDQPSASVMQGAGDLPPVPVLASQRSRSSITPSPERPSTPTSSAAELPKPVLSSPIEQNSDYLSLASSGDNDSSEALITPTTDEHDDPPPWASAISEELPPGLRKRKPEEVKGYSVDSEARDDHSGESDKEEDTQWEWEPPDTFEIRANTNRPSMISVILPSLLPMSHVSDSIPVTSCTSFASTTFDRLTFYRELREAQLDSDFDRVIGKLAHEWYSVGASLLSIAAVDTSIFASDLFKVDNFAKRALIISSVAAAIGLFIDVWFIFAYSGADGGKFRLLARDLYGSYGFFAFSSRLPLVSVLVSILAFVACSGAFAWAAWPAAILVMCPLACFLVSLQFIVYGCHRIALGLAWMLHGIWLGAVYVSHGVRGLFTRAQGEGQWVMQNRLRRRS